jgi:hypothetical protein
MQLKFGNVFRAVVTKKVSPPSAKNTVLSKKLVIATYACCIQNTILRGLDKQRLHQIIAQKYFDPLQLTFASDKQSPAQKMDVAIERVRILDNQEVLM